MPTLFARPAFPFALAAAVCLALVGGGVAMAQLLNLAACPLCIVQRMLYLLLAVTSAVGALTAARPLAPRLTALAMAAIAGLGVFVAGYQVWIQRFARATNCSANTPWWEQLVDWAGERLPLLFQANGLCSDPAWKFLGLSIADWSLTIFAALLVLALATAFRGRKAG